MPSICGVRRPSNAQSIVGSLNYLGFGEGLPFEGLMSGNVIEVAIPAGTTTVSPSTVIRQLTSRSCSWTTFNFKRAVRLNWLNQSSLHNGDWKNAVSPLFLHKRTSEARGYSPRRIRPSADRLTVVRYQIQAALAQLKLARCPHLLTASLAATAVRLGPFYVAHPIRPVRRMERMG